MSKQPLQPSGVHTRAFGEGLAKCPPAVTHPFHRPAVTVNFDCWSPFVGPFRPLRDGTDPNSWGQRSRCHGAVDRRDLANNRQGLTELDRPESGVPR